MSAAPRTAVVLAAGMGSRLQDIWPDLPKGFIVIGDETLIERSIRLLQLRAVARIVIVAGHLGDAYHELAKRLPGVEVVHNPDFASTGSMASLARALDEVDEDFLLLESDLFYVEESELGKDVDNNSSFTPSGLITNISKRGAPEYCAENS